MKITRKKNDSIVAPHIRSASFLALFALWLLICASALVFLGIFATALFFWSWDGPKLLALSLIPFAVCAGSLWAARKLTRSGSFARTASVEPRRFDTSQ
jgi:hypothetical protein